MQGTLHLSLLCIGLQLLGFISQSSAQTDDERLAQVMSDLDEIQTYIGALAKQVQRQQLRMEERIRTEGGTGVKVRRATMKGLKNYYSASHVQRAQNSIHDHSNYDRTIGMGEIVVVMNGLEFRTRHNDYKLYMASTTSTEYQATEDIPFPPVPPEVLNTQPVSEEIKEMVEYFRAFKTQNITHRDYRNYFRANLCYMEGMWTLDKNITEPFKSDRHSLNAKSWFDMQEKIRFNSYSGVKDNFENFAYLPTTIWSIDEVTGEPTYAQWNYRILCAPIQGDFPFKYMVLNDDVSQRLTRQFSIDQVVFSRGARFKIYNDSSDNPFQLLDEIFAEIPGLDNVPPPQTQAVLGDETLFDLNSQDQSVPKNTGYYHRLYRDSVVGAGRPDYKVRGFNDENLWVATTSQPRVAPMCYEDCSVESQCVTKCNRVSYAMPLEIVYMTPLLTWNPYNLPYWEKAVSGFGGRNGGDTLEKAYNGTDKETYYITPTAFFTGDASDASAADTVQSSAYVLDLDNNLHSVAASGTRILTPDIGDVGPVRLRWPVAPIYGEGSSVWKEVNALRTKIVGDIIDGPPVIVFFDSGMTYQNPPGAHNHEVEVSYEDFLRMKNDKATVTVTSTLAQGHTHTFVMKYSRTREAVLYTSCDGYYMCRDGHEKIFDLKTVSAYVSLNA